MDRFSTLVLLGPPGSGKGSIGKTLSLLRWGKHISSGDVLRSISPRSSLGQEFQKRAKKGLLMPDEEVVSCVKKYLEKEEKLRLLSKKRDYLILDGIPRTERQVELLQPFIAVRLVICLYVKDQQVLAQRIAGRAKKQKRVDDQDPMVLKKRLEEYETKTAGIIKKYPSHIVASVAADQPLVKVFQEALQHICKTF